MKQILFILSVIFWMVSCTLNRKTEEIVNQEKYEIEIIVQTLPQLVHPMPPPPPPPFFRSGENLKEFNDSVDEVKKDFKQRVDTTQFTVYLLDTLFTPNKSEFTQLTDSMYNGLAHFFLADTLRARPIDISLVDSLCSYKLLTGKPHDFRNSEFGFLGVVAFSRMVFNESLTSAFFYFERSLDRDDGSGHLILVEKRNGKWIIIRNDIIWIS